MRLTRRDSEERKQAILEHFLKHPDSTGDEAQALLVSGKLTGKKGPQLSTGVLYELRKRATTMNPQRPGGAGAATLSDADLLKLRERALEIQKLLAAAPGVASVIITRDGARIERLREEPL